ncbi:poly-gamma-glutamate system protein [bacterium]|nr:poly-gamma-glutamate system protein [bacterium]MBU1983934.1 poly-gamma-glutamate system protein [bacterium]
MRYCLDKRFFIASLLTALVALGALAQTRHPAYDHMVRAAKKVRTAQETLYDRKVELGIADSTLDPQRTGVIGVEYSPITTTVGYLKSKRAAANPDFAAHIVRELLDHGVGPDDSVLVNMTGSFPGLNLAVMMALDALDIRSLRFCSVGASSYGANQEEFTWLDMEDILYRDHLLKRRSNFVTLGGTGDVGGGLSDEARDILKEKALELNYPIIKARSLRRQIRLRMKYIGDPRRYSLLINVGGNHAMLGNGGRQLPGGWNEPGTQPVHPDSLGEPQGIVFDFLANGVPVLNLLHIEDVARQACLPFDPDTLSPPGVSPVYFLIASSGERPH